MNKTTPREVLYLILSWLVTLLMPLAVTLAAVRLTLNPWFVEFEYRTPNFPADPYGFTQAERLKYSRQALDYLVNDAGIEFLADLRFPEGQQAPPSSCQFMEDCTKLYNERELSHMLDVKLTVQATLRIWYVTLAVLLGLGVWAWLGRWAPAYWRGASRGGWLSVILVGVIILLVLVLFGWFFIKFHQVLFTAGTWTFYYSDTLIRLFPERFWRDTFIVVGSLAVGIGLAVAFGARVIGNRIRQVSHSKEAAND
jgi:integral membrane protein (TIGR01906 family)